MNLSKKIIVILLCLISLIFITVGIFLLKKIDVFETCWVVSNNNYHFLITQNEPFWNSKRKEYQIHLFQNNNQIDLFVNKQNSLETNFNQEKIYLFKIQKLATYFQLNQPFQMKIKEINFWESLVTKNTK